MRLHAHEVKTGPHWVRVRPDAEWFLLDIQQPDGLSYGLADAEFVPVSRPGTLPSGLLPPDHPIGKFIAEQCNHHRRAEAAVAAAADDIQKICEAFKTRPIDIDTESDRIVIRFDPETRILRDATAEKARQLLPAWNTREPAGFDCGFVYVEKSVLGEEIKMVIYSLTPENAEPAPTPTAEPSIEPQEEPDHGTPETPLDRD